MVESAVAAMQQTTDDNSNGTAIALNTLRTYV